MLIKFKNFETINENLAKARAVLRQVDKPQTNPDFVKLRSLLSNNLGYIGKFTEWMFLNKVSYDQLESLYNRIKDQRLSKPIDQFSTPEEVIDSLIRKTTQSDLNQMLSAIPSQTREFLKECDDFDQLENFLTQHADKKAAIIDFFSKKGGRYGEYDEYEVIDQIIEDLDKVVDAKSISDIAQIAKTSTHVKFVLENAKVLIVAVDYEGIQEVGSNYWCITEDEYTFSDYVLEGGEPRIQLAFYFKDKIPFVDDQSVLGVTWDLEGKSIYAAHWEDDNEYDQQRKNDPIISYLKPLNDQLFQIAMSLYDFENTNWFWNSKQMYGPKVQQAINQFKETGKDSALVSLLLSYIGWCSDEDRETHEQSFMSDFISKLKSDGIKLNIPIEDVIHNNLHDISVFNKSWLEKDITEYVEDYVNYYSDEDHGLIDCLKWFKSNGYDLFGKCSSLETILMYCKLGLIEPQQLLSRYSIEEIMEDDENDRATSDIFNYLLKNKPEEITKVLSKIDYGRTGEEIVNQIFGVLIQSPKDNLETIRNIVSFEVKGKSILGLVSKGYLTRLLNVQDERIQSAAAYQMIPQELKDLFDITLSKKAKEEKSKKVPTTKKSKK